MSTDFERALLARIAKAKEALEAEEAAHPKVDPKVDPVVATEEVAHVFQSAFQKRAKEEEARFTRSTDSEYWVCVCFETRPQKEAFLEALKLADLGDKHIDGIEVARRLNVALPPREAFRQGKLNRGLADLAQPEPGEKRAKR